MDTVIDKFSSNFYGETDVALYIIELYKNNLPEEKDLYIKLGTEVCTKILERATYWNRQGSSSDEEDEMKICQYKAKHLQDFALKLKQTPFKRKIMREIKYLTTK